VEENEPPDRTMDTTVGVMDTMSHIDKPAPLAHTLTKKNKRGQYESTQWGDTTKAEKRQDTDIKGKHVTV
jgi:hypothetical protein